MGLPMTKRLLSKGHSVVAHDIVPEKTEAARAAGAKAADSPAGTCAGLAAKRTIQLIGRCGNAVRAKARMRAQAAGIGAARTPACLAGGHADSTLLQQIFPRMAGRDFAPRGYARQMLKDLEMVNELAA